MGRYPWAKALLFEVLHIIVFYPTRRRIYRVAVLAAMIYVAAQIYLTQEFTDPLKVTFGVGFTIASHFIFTAYLLFAEGSFPDHWRRVRDEVHTNANAGGLDKPPSNFPLAKKIWWMVDIAYSVRMIGWVQEPRDSMPPHPKHSRRTFLWKTFLKFIVNTAVTDFMESVHAPSPAFDHRLHDPTDGSEAYLAAVPLLRRVPCVLAFGIGVGTGMSAIHNFMALVCVGLGYSSPALWPDIWGRWGDAYTVRKLWGRTWHQRVRPMFTGLGRLVANNFLRFPRGTDQSSYTQLYLAFLLSGLLHFAGDFMFERRIVYRSFKFCLLQAIVITFEDLIIHIATRLLCRRGTELKPGRTKERWVETVMRVIGYCWVTLWFCLTLPIWVDEPNTVGFFSSDRGPITQFLLDAWKRWA